jgi:hypothetical protein
LSNDENYGEFEAYLVALDFKNVMDKKESRLLKFFFTKKYLVFFSHDNLYWLLKSEL